jgi:hypothetical protein
MKWYDDLETQIDHMPDDLWVAFARSGLGDQFEVDFAQVLVGEALTFLAVAGDEAVIVRHASEQTTLVFGSLEGGIYTETAKPTAKIEAVYEHTRLSEPLRFAFEPRQDRRSRVIGKRAERMLAREEAVRTKLREWASGRPA